jgi:hypothetical protein
MTWDELHTPDTMVKLDDSTFVEQDVLNVVQKIYEYDPNLKVQYLERAAAMGDAPYRVIERCNDGEWRVIFYAWKLDERVLERIRMADCHMVDVLSTVDKHNASLRQREGRRFQERMGEANDLTTHILKSPKGRYTFKDGEKLVTVDDDPKPSWKVEDVS